MKSRSIKSRALIAGLLTILAACVIISGQSAANLFSRPGNGASSNGTVVSTIGPAITDSTGVAWTIQGSGCGAPNCLAYNGTVWATTADVVEIAYVNGVVWQEASSTTPDQWYAVALVGGSPTLTAGGTTQSPLTSANDTLITTAATVTNGVNSPAIVDVPFNNWTITSGAQMAVNGVAITVTSAVTAVCYVSGIVYQYGSGQWYPVATVNGASTTFGSGSPTAPASTCAPGGTQVALGCYCNGPGGSGFDAQWATINTVFGRPATISTMYLNWNGYAENTWEASAGSVISALQADNNTKSTSGTTLMLAWPFGNGTGGSGNFFSNISGGTDDAIIQNVLGQLKAAGFTTLILRPAWEMNGTWYGWEITSSGVASAYVAAAQHFYTLVHTYASANGMTINVTWNPNIGGIAGEGYTALISTIFPGCAYVDSLSVDNYGNDGSAANDFNSTGSNGGESYNMYLMASMAAACSPVKPISGSEIGALGSAYISAEVAWLNTVGVPISYWSFWDSNGSENIPGGAASWSVTTDANCSTANSGAGGSTACGAASSPPVVGSVAGYWYAGFNATNGTVTANQ